MSSAQTQLLGVVMIIRNVYCVVSENLRISLVDDMILVLACLGLPVLFQKLLSLYQTHF